MRILLLATLPSAALDSFYPRVLGDPILAPYFEEVDMSHLKGMAEAFLAMAFGGPSAYHGPGLRAAHARPRRQGMGDVEFDRFMELFGTTLVELGLPEAKIGEVAAIALAARNDVLGR